MTADQLATMLARTVDDSGEEARVEGAVRNAPGFYGGYQFQVGTPEDAYLVLVVPTDAG